MFAAIVITTNMTNLLLIWAKGIHLKKMVLTRKTENEDRMAILSLLYLYASSAELYYRISRNEPSVFFVSLSQNATRYKAGACSQNLKCFYA